jgi:hypothetical protein
MPCFSSAGSMTSLSRAYCSSIRSWASALTRRKHLVRGEAVVAGGDGAELDLLLEAGDADLEEFVEVAGDDAEEAQALEQRHAGVGRLAEDAAVEGEQGQFPVEEVLGREAFGARCLVH